MSLVHLSLLILIGIIVLNRYSGLWGKPRKKAAPRPPYRDAIEVLRPQADDEPFEEPDVELAAPQALSPSNYLTVFSIFAVHGLGSDADWSWTWQKGDDRVEWLRDPRMLPKKVKRARILVYYYHSRWDVDAPDTCLQECGEALVRRIHNFRGGKMNRPLLFIGHSLGGLVIEYGLLWADSQPEFRYFTHYTVGCIFLGCPFRGSKMQPLARIMALILSFAGSQIGIIEEISYDNRKLFKKLNAFCILRENALLPVCCFSEQYRTDYGRKIGIPWILAGKVVGDVSACIPGSKLLPLDTDHLKLNKFADPNDRSFGDVTAEITEMYRGKDDLLKRRRCYWREQYLMIPFGRNENFVGRESIVQRLLDRIPPDAISHTCQRTALEGLGGVGKTQIAVEAIYRFHRQDPNCSIFWIPALNSTAFEDAYRKIGRKLQIPRIDEVDADVKGLVKEALENWEMGRWLLVVDSADDTKLLFALARYLPNIPHGSILFTTRNRHAAIDMNAMHIKVEPMHMSEAFKLLGSGDLDSRLVEGGNTPSTRQLLSLLMKLPLAIAQASDYLNKTQITSAEYLKIYQSSETDMVYLLSWTFETDGRYDTVENPIITTFFTSFRQIQEMDSLAVDYLRLMSFLADHDIPRELLPSGSSLGKMHEAIGKLMAFAFVTRRDSDSSVSYNIHRLVQASVRAWMRENDKKGEREWDKFSDWALTRLEDLLPFPDHMRQDAWTSYLAHAQTVLKFQLDTNYERAKVLLQKIERSPYCLDV